MIYLVVFCLELVTLLIFNFGGSACDDELCVLIKWNGCGPTEWSMYYAL